MFLSKETRFIRPLLFRDLMRWPACQNTADCTALVAVQNRLPLWIISLALEAGECILAVNIKGLMDYHTMLVCMDLFFLSVNGCFQPHDVTFFGFLGASPLERHRGFHHPDPLPVPLPNQNPGSATGDFSICTVNFYLTDEEDIEQQSTVTYFHNN